MWIVECMIVKLPFDTLNMPSRLGKQLCAPVEKWPHDGVPRAGKQHRDWRLLE